MTVSEQFTFVAIELDDIKMFCILQVVTLTQLFENLFLFSFKVLKKIYLKENMQNFYLLQLH